MRPASLDDRARITAEKKSCLCSRSYTCATHLGAHRAPGEYIRDYRDAYGPTDAASQADAKQIHLTHGHQHTAGDLVPASSGFWDLLELARHGWRHAKQAADRAEISWWCARPRAAKVIRDHVSAYSQLDRAGVEIPDAATQALFEDLDRAIVR